MNSPFTISGISNSNLGSIGNINVPALRDNLVSDGWQLIQFNFGKHYNTAGIASIVTINHPEFVLYNKYSGILRILIYNQSAINHADYQTALIRLSSDKNISGGYESAILSLVDSVSQAVEDYHKKKNATVFNNLRNSADGYWLMADIPMAYDPCVCSYQYNILRVEYKLIQTSKVDLTGTLATTNLVNVAGGLPAGTSPAVKEQSKFMGALNELSGTTKKINNGLKVYKDAADVVNSFNGIVNISSSPEIKKKWDALNKYLKLASNAAATADPKIGILIGVVNTYITSGKLVADPKTTPKESSTKVIFDATERISGNISSEMPSGDFGFVVPGSYYPSAFGFSNEIPMYHEPLGIMNLLETPKLTYIDYNTYGMYQPNLPLTPPIRQYQIEPLKYVVNPSSGLTLKELKASIVVDYYNADPKPEPYERYPVLFNKTFATNTWKDIEECGYNLERHENNRVRISIGSRPIGCFNNSSFFLYGPYGPSNASNLPQMYIRLTATLYRTLDPSGPTTLWSVMFPVKDFIELPCNGPGKNTYKHFANGIINGMNGVENIEFPPEDYKPLFQFSSKCFPNAPAFSTSNNFVIDNPLFENRTISGHIHAWDQIIIGKGCVISPGTILTGGEGVLLDDDITVDPTVTLETGYPAGCNADPNTLKVTDLSSWCNAQTNSTYDPEVPTSPYVINEKDPAKSKLDVTLLGNPVNNTLEFKVTNTLEQKLNVIVADQYGKQLFTKIIDNAYSSDYYYILNVENLQPGLYYLTVTDSKSRKTKKVIKMNN
jgi:hypothetical protein